MCYRSTSDSCLFGEMMSPCDEPRGTGSAWLLALVTLCDEILQFVEPELVQLHDCGLAGRIQRKRLLASRSGGRTSGNLLSTSTTIHALVRRRYN